MEDVKQNAIANYVEEQKKEAKSRFQEHVNTALFEISNLSGQLKAAKKRLLELEYKEPEALEI